jgi:hypothetical protein
MGRDAEPEDRHPAPERRHSQQGVQGLCQVVGQESRKVTPVDGLRLYGQGMSYSMEVPVEPGGHFLVEVSEQNVAKGLQVADRGPSEVVARASALLAAALDSMRPVAKTVCENLSEMSLDETTAQFGRAFGDEMGIIFAKGTAVVHFSVTRSPKGPDLVDGTGDG